MSRGLSAIRDILWGAVCLKTYKESIFTNEVDVYLPDRCLETNLCLSGGCLATRSMFSNQIFADQIDV